MQEIIALHRYWLTANVMKRYFERSAEEIVSQIEEGRDSPFTALAYVLSDSGTFMAYWYAALFVVVEGYRELSLSDSEIDSLLQSPYVEQLRRFRNGTFHYQRDWFSSKLAKIHKDTEHVDWVRQLHARLGHFLLDQVKQTVPPDRREAIEAEINAFVLEQSSHDNKDAV